MKNIAPNTTIRSFLHFLRNNSGNVATTFAVAIIPIVGAAGAAVDYSRIYRHEAHLQYINDAAAIAAAASGKTDLADLKAIAKDFLESNGGYPYMKTPDSFDVKYSTSGTLLFTVEGKLDATFMGIFGHEYFDMDIATEVSMGTNEPREVALVLDVTGSMRNDMVALRSAAAEFVNVVKPDNLPTGVSDYTKIAVVPYAGAVNIGNDGVTQMPWMDVTAKSQYHGDFLERRWYGYTNPCATPPTPSTGGGGSNPGPGDPGDGGGDRSSIMDRLTDFASNALGFFSVSSARAQTITGVPSGFTVNSDCGIIGPDNINHFELFQKLDVKWKGCVEARPAPYDVTDVAPVVTDANSLFVPYFWHDESDEFASWVADNPNDYMEDGNLFDAWQNANFASKIDRSDWIRTYDVTKYDSGNTPQTDEIGPDTLGPNASCPDQMLPLTDNKLSILSKVASLSHFEGSGTNSAQGLMWGWRAISPGAPFTQGQPYGTADKTIVIMTDGKNAATPSPSSVMLTDYNAYGPLRGNEFLKAAGEPETYGAFSSFIDSRLATACTNAKAAGIKIFTVTFGTLDADTRQLFQNCASSPDYYANVSDKTKLQQAFSDIAQEINKVRIVN